MASSPLLDWYDRHRRDLPWRRTRDPYRIWISEIMLQQTQVTAVLPYYRAFLERFPTVGDLAESDVEEVLALWSGLGYYRRARQMHRAARQVTSSGRGFPTSAAELERLPGIGPYTAAAIASIAFGEVVPVLDGNVERLLCRRIGLAEDPKRAVTRRRLLAAAQRLLDSGRPGDSNQALMELGATVCRPLNPHCPRCPLGRGCRARQEGDPHRYPPARRRRGVERQQVAVAVVRRGGRILLFRRPEDSDFLPGMWELPNVPREGGTEKLAAAFTRRYGGRWRLTATSARVRHGVTFRSLVLHIYEAELVAGERVDGVADGTEAAWVDDGERVRFPASSMVDKVLSRFTNPTS